MIYNRPPIPNVTFDNKDRFFPFLGFFPLVTGALIGGAAVAVSRPRPIVGYPAYPPMYPPSYGTGYNYSSYGHYPY